MCAKFLKRDTKNWPEGHIWPPGRTQSMKKLTKGRSVCDVSDFETENSVNHNISSKCQIVVRISAQFHF